MAQTDEILTYYHPVTGAGTNLNDDVSYRMIGHEGFGIGDFEHFATGVPEQQGDVWAGVRLGAKVVTIDLLIRGSSLVDIQNKRRALSQLFNPLLVNPLAGQVGKLRLQQSNGVVLQMDCVLAEAVPMPTSAHIAQRAARFQFRFRSVRSPSLYDATPQTVTYSQASGTAFSLPFSFPFTLAVSGIFTAASVVNAGDFRTPVIIDILGPALNPIITNATQGRALAITGTIPAGQHFIVNTDPDVLTATLNGVSRLDMVTGADFWDLLIGSNSLLWDIGGTDTNTRGTITWTQRYLGG